jgi:hypothetical protein
MPAPIITKVASNVADTSGVAPGALVFSFTPTAGKTYIIEGFYRTSGATSTTGVQFAVTDNTGGVSFGLRSLHYPTAGTTFLQSFSNVSGTFSPNTASFGTSVLTAQLTLLYYHFKAPAVVTGDVEVYLKSETAGLTCTVYKDSITRVTEIA